MKPTTMLCCLTLAAACTNLSPPPTSGQDRLAEVQFRLGRTPDDQQLLQELVATAAAEQQLPIALEILQPRTDASGLWYQGRIRFLMAEVGRALGRTTEALATLDTAMQCFAAAMEQNPAWRDDCEQWLALCLGKKGNIAFLTDDLAHAEQWLLEATRLRPDCIDTDLGGSQTTKHGLLRVGDRVMRDFARAEALYRAAIAAADTDVDLLNNAAVFARDRGNQLERGGEVEAATEMYERSYRTYCRAVQLDPRSVRLRNDCALIAIHHLECDWAQSRQLLDTAITDGEAMLRDDLPRTARDRQDLDEAIGDCYENLALWHLRPGQDPAAAKAAAIESLAHFPQQQRTGARRHLATAELRQSNR